MALTDQLVSYWKFDESSGNAADSVGSNTLTNINTAAYASAKINNGIDLERGSSQQMQIAHASQSGLQLTTLTIACWVNFESLVSVTNDTNTFATKGNIDGLTEVGYIFWLSKTATDRKLFFWWRIGTNDANQHSVVWEPSTATWYHVAVTFDNTANECKFYVNGSQQGATGTSLATALQPEGNQPFIVGNHSDETDSGKLFDGIIDELGVWSRALSSTEISSLYNGGTGLSYPFGGVSVTATPTLGLLGVGT